MPMNHIIPYYPKLDTQIFILLLDFVCHAQTTPLDSKFFKIFS